MDLSLSPSSLSLSSKVDTNQDSIGSPSMRDSPNWELDPIVPCIILNLEKEEKEMAPNLRVNFKEKQHKRLFKALSVASPPPKRTCSEVSHEESIPDAPMV